MQPEVQRHGDRLESASVVYTGTLNRADAAQMSKSMALPVMPRARQRLKNCEARS
jgi:hypothetical protein